MKKALQTGYGLGLLSLAKAKKVVTKVKKDLNLNEKESLKLAEELVKSSEKASKDVVKAAHKYFHKALAKSKRVKAAVKKPAKKKATKKKPSKRKTTKKK